MEFDLNQQTVDTDIPEQITALFANGFEKCDTCGVMFKPVSEDDTVACQVCQKYAWDNN